MAYSELIKNFDRIRDYMREFYVYGFKRRGEVDIKSARGYDDERRRIESWLADAMGFRHTPEGKQVFLSVDSRSIAGNPLHKAFRAKSFTRNDITLHFVLLDMLRGGAPLSVRQIVERISTDYLARVPGAEAMDESTVRKKLKEYERLGLVRCEAEGRKVRYALARDDVDVDAWADAIAFYAEADSLGVVGSYLLGRLPEARNHFRFKHHYLLRVLDSEPLRMALGAIYERRDVMLIVGAGGHAPERRWLVTPVKVLASTQTGRYYLCAYSARKKRLCLFRMDHIRRIEWLDAQPEYAARRARFERVKEHLWGAGISGDRRVDHIEVTVRVGENEGYIAQRLMRERRQGRVEQVDETHWRFSADVYDPYEVGPWLRTFIGRITDLRCSDPSVTRRFWADVRAMHAQYGGNADAVQ